jgi:UDP-3-O-[3-hydroxymyristoyl] glucosamine N-acyltransferase
VLGDDVEVGANTTIDRGAIDDTVIEDGVKLDDQIHVAHNVRIGANTAIAACAGIAGSAVIGRNCEIGGAAMIRGHIEIADGTRISPGTAITRSLRAGTYTGLYPFDDHASWLRNAAGLRHLSSLIERVRRLEKRLLGKESNRD